MIVKYRTILLCLLHFHEEIDAVNGSPVNSPGVAISYTSVGLSELDLLTAWGDNVTNASERSVTLSDEASL